MDAAGRTLFWAVVGGAALLAFSLVLFLGWWRSRGRRRRAVDETRAYLKGVHYLLSDNPDAAIEELTRVVEVNTETIETYFALGALFRRKGELERAIRIHRNIILRPGLPEETRQDARFELAMDYRRAGMLKQARDAFAQVVDDPGRDRRRQTDALAWLRDLSAEAGEWAEAVDAQKRRMKLVDGDEQSVLGHLLAGLARSQLSEKRPDDARKAAKEALKADPESVDVYLAAAEVALSAGDLKAALGHYESALERLPEAIVLAHAPLADLFYRQDRFEEFGDYLRGWVDRHPEVPHLRLVLARHLRKRGLTDAAVGELRAALDIDPRFHDARQELGRILLEEKKDVELRRQFEELLETMAPEPGFRCDTCGHGLTGPAWRCPRCGGWDTVRRAEGRPGLPEGGRPPALTGPVAGA